MNLLFLCTHNACRSVLCEVITRAMAGERLQVASAGSEPAGRIHPLTLQVLESEGFDTAGLQSQDMEACREFGPDAVITVCDSAAQEACPVWLGAVRRAHWGLPDPTALAAGDDAQLAAFQPVMATIRRRVKALLEAPFETLDDAGLDALLEKIGEID